MKLLVIIFGSLITGILSGLVGIGAGLLTTIMLIALGYEYPYVVTTTLFLHVLPQTIPGFIQYYKQGYFLLKESLIIWLGLTIGITIGAYFGSLKYIPIKYLNYILSLLLMLSSIFLLYNNHTTISNK
jgi:uncharacterized membrane protein YfcA